MFIWSLLLSIGLSRARAVEVECEHYLSGPAKLTAERELRRAVADLPFPLVHAYEITPAARKKLKLGREIAARPELARTLVATLHRTADATWTMCLRRLEAAGVFECAPRTFPDHHPLLWQMVRVDAHAVDQAASTPLPRRENLMRDHRVGFTTDPDEDGIRVYIRAHDHRDEQTVYLELGLDVPVAQLDRYLSTIEIKRGHGHLLQTPVTQFRRVPAFLFARPK